LPNWKKLILSGSDAALNSLNVTTSVTAASFTGSFSGSVAAPGSTTQVVFNNGGTLSANSGFVYSGSNVGIGVTNPPVTLSVQGISYFANDIYLRDGSTTTGDFLVRIYDSSDDGIIDVYRNNAVVNRIHGNGTSFITAGDFGIGMSSPASRLQVQGSGATSATSALNVTNSTPTSLLFVRDDGRVGIGTTSPQYRLQLSAPDTAGSTGQGATISVSSNVAASANNGGSIIFGDTSLADRAMIKGAFAGATGSEGYLALSTRTASSGLAEVMRLTGTGNVGIGTTSPASTTRLQIQGTGTTSATSALNVTNSTPTSLLFVRDDGNIGINNTSPTGKLDIQGVSTEPPIIIRQGGTGAPAFLTFSGNYGGWVFENTDTGGRKYQIATTRNASSIGGGRFIISDITSIDRPGGDTSSSGDVRICILGTGEVGIGTTTPSQKLDVQGNIAITKALLSNQENLDVDSGATRVIATISSTSYDAAFFDFVIKKSTNLRAGTLYAVHNGITTEFTETSTQDLGNTSDVTLSVDISGGNIRLLATTLTNDWIIKTLVRGI
jgi:hypothetical protein